MILLLSMFISFILISSFFENIDRFLQPSYIPTTQDVLRARVRSTGIEEAEFKFEGIFYVFRFLQKRYFI